MTTVLCNGEQGGRVFIEGAATGTRGPRNTSASRRDIASNPRKGQSQCREPGRHPKGPVRIDCCPRVAGGHLTDPTARPRCGAAEGEEEDGERLPLPLSKNLFGGPSAGRGRQAPDRRGGGQNNVERGGVTPKEGKGRHRGDYLGQLTPSTTTDMHADLTTCTTQHSGATPSNAMATDNHPAPRLLSTAAAHRGWLSRADCLRIRAVSWPPSRSLDRLSQVLPHPTFGRGGDLPLGNQTRPFQYRTAAHPPTRPPLHPTLSD
ncbi:hypothetical protein QBC39DRAFT_70288 [Podospora conica]|nr:hypothetical protein QBC39DRAFT_70288 [Schizothecium conicum]